MFFFKFENLGPCELTDIPEEGAIPRFWEYERTMPQRFWVKYIIRGSEMGGMFTYNNLTFKLGHESNLSKAFIDSTLRRWK